MMARFRRLSISSAGAEYELFAVDVSVLAMSDAVRGRLALDTLGETNADAKEARATADMIRSSPFIVK